MRGLIAGALTGALVGSTIIARPITHAQPAPADVERAKDLYTAARTALDEGRHADAIRDFGTAYELTKDPVMFYWIGNANEKAGKCDVALTYFGRYLKEGQPSAQFLETVRQRIIACGGNPDAATGSAKPSEPADPGSAVPPAGPGSAGSLGGAAAEPVADGAGSGTLPPPVLRAKHQGPWLLVGGSIAMLTVGIVLAYSADASERDIDDLYVGLEGNPPVFDKRTKQRYDDLIAEGERYERLSWVSFGLAAGLAGGAAIWYLVTRNDADAPVIAPAVEKNGAGVSATVRW